MGRQHLTYIGTTAKEVVDGVGVEVVGDDDTKLQFPFQMTVFSGHGSGTNLMSVALVLNEVEEGAGVGLDVHSILVLLVLLSGVLGGQVLGIVLPVDGDGLRRDC